MSRGIRALVIFFAFVLIYTLARSDLQHKSTDTTPPSVAYCAGSQIQAEWINGSGAAGSVYSWVKLTNSSKTCKLPTWLLATSSRGGGATESFLHAATDSQLTRQDGSAIRASKFGVVIPTEKSAFIAVSFSDGYSCPQADSVVLSWNTSAKTESIDLTPTYLATSCAGSSIVMSPVYR